MSSNAESASLSIVIVTWNGKQYALECLESIRTMNSRHRVEVIVVDNASTDGTPEAISARYPEVKLFRNEQNLGFARANNLGMEASQGDYVALVNSDVVVPPRCVDTMIDYLEANPDIGMLGPRMLSPEGGYGQSVNRVPTVWNFLCAALALHQIAPNSRRFGGYGMLGYGYDKTEDVEVLTGWFWMVPRRALEQVGGLDERFFMYGEDLDWSYRFHKHGWRVVFFAEAEALHYGAASSAKDPYRFYIEKTKANLQFFEKHYGWFGGLAFILITLMHESLRLAGYCALYCANQGQRAASAAKIRRAISCLKWVMKRWFPSGAPVSAAIR